MSTESTESVSTEPAANNAPGYWPQSRRLLVFQFKLDVDAFRDFALSFLSLGAFLLDVINKNSGDDSYFQRVLKFGRRTERAINLFNQHHPDEQDQHSVDKFIDGVEERMRKDNKE